MILGLGIWMILKQCENDQPPQPLSSQLGRPHGDRGDSVGCEWRVGIDDQWLFCDECCRVLPRWYKSLLLQAVGYGLASCDGRTISAAGNEARPARKPGWFLRMPVERATRSGTYAGAASRRKPFRPRLWRVGRRFHFRGAPRVMRLPPAHPSHRRPPALSSLPPQYVPADLSPVTLRAEKPFHRVS
jgi:hypothetical protein